MKNNTHSRLMLLVVVMMMTTLIAQPSHAVRTVVWDKTAIPLLLVVGVEQMLHFESSVTPGLTELLSDEELFRAMSVNGTVYMTALRAFDKQRVKFKLKNGDYILIDLSAEVRKAPPQTMEPIKVLSASDSEDEFDNAAGQHTQKEKRKQVSVFDVLRYGIQDLVSPKRVIKPVDGIRAVSLKINGDLNRLYQSHPGESLSITVVQGWSAGGVYVTALKVSNTGASAIAFDLSRLQHTHKTIVNGVNNQFIASAMLKQTGGVKADDTGIKPARSAFVLVATEQPFASVLDL